MSISTDPPTDPHQQPDSRPRAQVLLRAVTPFVPVISAALALGLVLGLIVVGVFRPDPAPVTSSAAGPGAAQAAAQAGAGKTMTFDIELGDLYVKPSSIEIDAGAKVKLNVVNKGAMDHTIALKGEDTPMIKPGAATTLDWGPINETTQAWCTVEGHKAAGMVLDIKVKGAAAGGGSDAVLADTKADPNAGNAKIDANAKPSADWKAVDPTVKPADGKTVHEVDLHVKEKKSEVAPGVTQTLWTYNGTAPGPTLRGKVGDTFRVKLTNDGSMNHSIDFHASKVAPNVEMRDLKPGESLVYEFKANYAGIFTYHCGAAPMIHHMGNGMFGAVIVDPPNLPKVDKEIVLVQSELYLGPEGKAADLNKMMAGTNDGVVFNGYFNQYVHNPVKVDVGDRVRIWLDNAAINEPLAFHTVGLIFDTVWKEGAYLLKPGSADKGGSQTLDLSTTQGGFVEFTVDKAGTYTFVNHIMKDLSRGAAGLLVAGDGGPAAH
ncbi:multicopper oxidase domain-containing protein [Streptomyces sp. NPDC086080]|uniref:multicopper oxidase domain-containing protein n=1 Tax=Streptomyces sp. NPDC086080 TaxID=3365748 RepID=UPI0037CD1C8B